MELLGTFVNAAVMAALATLLGFYLKGRHDTTDERIGRLETRIDHLEANLNFRLEAIRSDLTRVALAVSVSPEAGTGG